MQVEPENHCNADTEVRERSASFGSRRRESRPVRTCASPTSIPIARAITTRPRKSNPEELGKLERLYEQRELAAHAEGAERRDDFQPVQAGLPDLLYQLMC